MSSSPLPDNSTSAGPHQHQNDGLCQAQSQILPFNASDDSSDNDSSGQDLSGRDLTGQETESRPEPALQALLAQAMKITSASGAAIGLGKYCDGTEAEGDLYCQASTGAPAPEVGARLHAGIGLTRLCLDSGEILLCSDTNTDRRVDPQLCEKLGIRSVLVLPIKAPPRTEDARVVGVLEVVSTRRDAFNAYDADAMIKLADQVLPMLSAKTDALFQRVSVPAKAGARKKTRISTLRQ